MIENKNKFHRAMARGSGLSGKGSSVNGAALDSEKVRLVMRNLKLQDDRFVGLFSLMPDGMYEISDIRRTDFSKLILQNGSRIESIFFSPSGVTSIEDGAYYEFSWLLQEADHRNYRYVFEVNEAAGIDRVSPESVIQRLHDSVYNSSASDGQRTVRMIDTLKSQLTAGGKEIFIYELLQNANDYPQIKDGESLQVDVEFHITDSYLLFMHSGDYFNEKNIAAICNINDKEKTDNANAIGYKGIGFKTIFVDNDYVYLRTGEYSFRFDRAYSKDIVDTPWQLLPIWTPRDEVDRQTDSIFEKNKDKFRVQFALRPTLHETLRDSDQNFVSLFEDVFRNERVILFIPNIRSVKVFFHDRKHRDIFRTKDSASWVVSTYAEEVSEELRESINREIDEQEKSGTLKIPTKYYDFQRTAVSFACNREGKRLKKVDDSILYCYLPAKDASWGFDFLMNTDMIPNGPRNDIETDLGINREISAIAGNKFFDWINDLCRSDENFNIADVFSLIPDFNACKRGVGRKYRQLIDRFQEEFEQRLLSEELVPTAAGDYACLKDIIIDDTFITLSGILDEQQFLEFSGMKGVLPAKELSSDSDFRTFAKRYADKAQIFNTKSLRRMISGDGFQAWLKDQDNNDSFLTFLLNKGLLPDFADEEIFIKEESGKLCPAGELYYDVDDDLTDLSEFSDYIWYLSLKTREKFRGNSSWKETVIPLFAEFDGQDFITGTLLDEENLEDTQKRLNDWDTSFHFFNYTARKNIVSDSIEDLPFIDDDGNPQDSFCNDFVFFSSEEGHKLFSRPWLSNVSAYFVSDRYNEQTLKYFGKNLGVREFSDDIIINEIILSSEYKEDINSSQQGSDADSLDFVKYCFSHKGDNKDKNKERFGSGSLSGYALSAADREGQTDYFIPEDDRIFFPSGQYDEFSAKVWLGDDWMYCLSSFYLEESSVPERELKEFIHKAFGINDCTHENFYEGVVRPHISDIIDNTSGDNDSDGTKNIDFISYLDANYELVFSKYNDSSRFKDIVLVAEGEYDISPRERHIYAYDEELGSIISSDWFPGGTVYSCSVYMCSHRYGSSKAITKIKAVEYTFSKFFDEVIRPNLRSINAHIDSIEKSIAFHNLVISHMKDLTPRQTEVMAGARVYIYGHDSPSEMASGHRTLSSMALELADKKLMEFSDLDVIDPEYKSEEHPDYWKSLGNREFVLRDFISWLEDNKSNFSQTISDKTRNIAFWQWAKENVPLNLADSLNDLPVLLTSGSMVAVSETVYLSDAYLKDGGIEAIVRQYQTDARFVSPEYLGGEAEKGTIEEWAEFWTHVGVMSEILDILESTVIPNLANIENEALPATLARYRSKLEDRIGSLPEKLTELRVNGRDGSFHPIAEAVYVDCEKDKDEPFSFVSLPEQISADDGDERRLIKDILECAGGNLIDSLTEWQSAKVERYLEVQDDEAEKELFDSIHYRFISELAGMYEKDETNFDYSRKLSGLKLFGKDGALYPASELTMGSAFEPLCDFEKYFPDGRQYLSDTYLNRCGKKICGMLQNVLHVHSEFEKDDIQSLADRDFAIYFWTKYLKKPGRVAHVRWWMEHCMFNAVPCIPTKDMVKKPSELYSVGIGSYVKNIVNGWENKLPLEVLPDIVYEDKESGKQKHLFDLLDFKQELDFTDALTALYSCTKPSSRRTVTGWMIDQYKDSYSSLVDKYRADEKATWFNSQNDLAPISRLYALEKDSMSWDYFHTLPRIINNEYLPAGYRLKKACDMLKIRIITDAALEVVPVGDKPANPGEKKILQLYALVIAGIEGSGSEDDVADNENHEETGAEQGRKWKKLYNDYKNKIFALKLWQCQQISVRFKEDKEISQERRKFHHETGSADFYYVKSLDDKQVFGPFVDSFMEYLGTDLPKEIVSSIMDCRDEAINCASEDNHLKLDEEFKAELSKLGDLNEEEKAGLKGNKADDEDSIEKGSRPTFTAPPQEDKQAKSEGGEPGQQDCNVNTPGMTEDGESDGRTFLNGRWVHVSEHWRSPPNRGFGGGFTSAENYVDPAARGETSGNSSNPDGVAGENSQDNFQDPTAFGTAIYGHTAAGADKGDGNTPGDDYREKPDSKDSTAERDPVEPEDKTEPESEIEIPWPNGDDEAGQKKTVDESGQEETTKEQTESDSKEHEGSDDGLDGNGQSEGKPRDFDGAFAVNEHGTAPKTSSGRHGTGNGSRGSRGERSAPRRPKPFSKDDVENFGSKGQTRTLDVLEPTETEVEAINSILGEGLSPEQIADQNYLVQLRLYNFLKENDMAPEESRNDFVRNGSRRREQSLHSGKYIHKCSAAGGIMYLSPAIWNKLASGRCIVLVYYGAKANSFMYFRTIDDILKWIREDDIVIKLTGEEKADAVSALYSGVLKGVKGTAYTLIRVKSNAKFNSLFAPLAQDPTEEHQENEGDYY